LPWRCGTAVKTTPAEIGTQGSSDWIPPEYGMVWSIKIF
jgi:hypothetical protein